MIDAKIYGLCLERLRYQIQNAHRKVKETPLSARHPVLLESYNTGMLDDIIDILELHDLEKRTFQNVLEKLDDLASTVSALTRESLAFDFTQEGHLGLYLTLGDASEEAGACRDWTRQSANR